MDRMFFSIKINYLYNIYLHTGKQENFQTNKKQFVSVIVCVQYVLTSKAISFEQYPVFQKPQALIINSLVTMCFGLKPQTFTRLYFFTVYIILMQDIVCDLLFIPLVYQVPRQAKTAFSLNFLHTKNLYMALFNDSLSLFTHS